MYLIKRNKIYHVYYRDDKGRLRSFSTKKSLKSEALEVALNYFNKPEGTQPLTNEITLQQFKASYLNYAANRFSPVYQKLVCSAFNQFAKTVNDSTPIREITAQMIEAFINMKLTEGKTQIINGYLRALQGAFQRAVEQGMLKENVFKKVNKIKFPENDPELLKPCEFEKIMETEMDPLLKSIYLFAINTGMRRDEIRLLKWESIDLENRMIHVKNHNEFTTKSKRSRMIPINDILLREINSSLIPSVNGEFVFMRNCRVLTREFITKRFRKAVKIAGLSNQYHFHTLRHTFASWLVQKGANLYDVSKLLGHSNITVTQIYSHLSVDRLRSVVEVLDK